MKKLFLLLLSLGFVACGPYKSYRLPLSTYEAPRTFAPLASVASQRGLRYAEHDTSVNIELDEATWVYFTIQNKAYNMVLTVDEELVGPQELEQKFQWAKAQADSMWEEAMAAYREAVPPTVIMQTAPPKEKKDGVNINIGF